MSERLDGSRWVLTGPGALRERIIAAEAVELERAATEITLLFEGDGVSGFSGVNRFRGRYHDGSKGFSIGPLASTRAAGPPELMAIEHDVQQRLESAATIVLDDESLAVTLVLLDGEDVELLTFTAPEPSRLRGEWVVRSIHYPEREAVATVDGTLTVHFENDRVGGNGGCNTFGGHCTVTGDALHIGPLMSTMMWGDDQAMAQEQALHAALRNATSFRISGAELSLLRPDGGISVTLQRA